MKSIEVNKKYIDSPISSGFACVYIPSESLYLEITTHVNSEKELWISKGYDAEVTNLSPEANPNEVSNAIEKMSIFKPRLVVFDCISYKTHTKNHVCSELNIPGVLAISTIANVIIELNYLK